MSSGEDRGETRATSKMKKKDTRIAAREGWNYNIYGEL